MTTLPSEALARREWAARMMRAKGAPPYGSPEWLALPEASPAKVAAVVRAAECWARDGDELEERLRMEVLYAREAHKAVEDADYVARRDAHSAEWTGSGFRQTAEDRAAVEEDWQRWVGGAS